MFGIYLGHREWAEEEAVKEVACDGCRIRYGYPMRRWAYGRCGFALTGARASESAKTAAARNARRKLERECELVPCPCCGLVPEAMIRALRQTRHPTLRVVAIVLLCVAGLFLTAGLLGGGLGQESPSPLSLGGYYLAVASGLLILRHLLNSRWDPNALAPDVRLRLARRLGRRI